MTLKQQIAADSTAVFLNTDEFAYDLVRRIQGNPLNTDTVRAVIEYVDETSRFGDAFVTDSDANGRRANVTVLLEVAADTLCQEADEYDLPNGDRAHYVKTIGEDEGDYDDASGPGLKTLLCRVARGITTKITRTRR